MDTDNQINHSTFLEAKNVTVNYGSFCAVRNVSYSFPKSGVVGMIGTSGCGKSTFLKSLNRMIEETAGCVRTGSILLAGQEIFEIDAAGLRRHLSIVFQNSCIFPMTVYENVAFGTRIHGIAKKHSQAEKDLVEHALQQADLWKDVKERLHQKATEFSGGQIQRMAIARALALTPEVLLLDEPCSSLDPIATSRIEDVILEIQKERLVVIVTHNMEQAKRICTAGVLYFSVDYDRGGGYLVEHGTREVIFDRPQHKATEDYVSGRLG